MIIRKYANILNYIIYYIWLKYLYWKIFW